MDLNEEAGTVTLIPPLTAVSTDFSYDFPGFLPAIDLLKSRLNISVKGGQYSGEGRFSLNTQIFRSGVTF